MLWPAESEVLHYASSLFVTAASLGCVYLLAASFAIYNFPRRRRRTPAPAIPVTILKPLHGAEPGLAERLALLSRQAYEGPIQIICGVRDASDPAIAAVTQVANDNPQAHIDIRIDPREYGSNRKVSNLVSIFPLARHDTIVISDSDIEVGPYYLADVTAELARPGVGAVTCVYHGIAGSGFWSRQAALAINTHFLPNVIAAVTFGFAQPCFGASIAIRRTVLACIGGFQPFADYLADDYAIGAAVRNAGWTVSIQPFSIGHVCFAATLNAMLANELRTARTVRSIDPVGYCGTIVTHPFPLALIGALLGGGCNAIALAVFAMACRGTIGLSAERAFGLERQSYWLMPLRDLLSFAVFVLSFFGATVSWRGTRYRVSADGRLTPASNRARS